MLKLSLSALLMSLCSSIPGLAAGQSLEGSGNDCSAIVSGVTDVHCPDSVVGAQEILEHRSHDGASRGQVEALLYLARRGYTFDGEDLSGINLSDADLSGVSLSKTRLHFANLDRVKGTHIDLSGSGIRFASLKNANISMSRLTEVYAPFVVAEGLRIVNSDLSQANFSGCSLQYGDFRNSTAIGAVFAFCDLRHADFSGADLSRANLEGALLDGAKFEGATIKSTALDGAVLGSALISVEQRQGFCRVRSEQGVIGSFVYDVQLSERWRSDKFESGFDFSDLLMKHSDESYFVDLSLDRCTDAEQDASGFDAEFPAEFEFSLDRDYLQYGSRRTEARDRVDNQMRSVFIEMQNPSRK